MPTTRTRTTTMPAEWEHHSRTWMAFPPPNATFGEVGGADLARARVAWSRVANTVVGFEPVTVLVRPEDAGAARELLDPRVELAEVGLDDSWLRDSGPTFVRGASGIQAVDWTFNGWGAQRWAAWDQDAQVARHVAELAGVPVASSSLVTEGGGFHVDGEGTVLLTDTVQLDPHRNPGWTREQVEAEVHAHLGTTKAIWLPRGLTADYGEFGTRGHVDIVAAFTAPGQVLVHTQTDPGHPDHEVSAEVLELLRTATDARGRRLQVTELLAPVVSEVDGELVDHSYVNHYVANGVVVLCAFADEHDAAAARVLTQAYPDREVVLVDARDIFAFGGGIHCITQQQPA
ncbi:agmatine deiminase [Quadrisphaera granulorum]|uniref:Agmatine deiminase n=2 Tax=Quadrisphaera granulorum TaxID=317664 RepID=A0A315ZUA8_9ACTN|nr:agmatine deiminase family protein [Quadrisphaera granulorum]PWJ48294.1 agmatine deiminase [Quadrisphaera granulorum]SZE98455.1 agmatine deiminase [Quadrisphaera granulorum]